MPNRKVESCIRFQGPPKKTKEVKTQQEPLGTAFGGPPEFMVVEDEFEDEVDDEPLFTKKRVPSTDELGSLLRSNLSSTLAAVRAHEAQQETPILAPSLPTYEHTKRLQNDDDEPPASLLKLAPICFGQQAKDDGQCASLLATTAIYRPLINDVRSSRLPAAVVERTFNDQGSTALIAVQNPVPENAELEPAKLRDIVDDSHNNNPSALLPATTEAVLVPGINPLSEPQAAQFEGSPTDTYAIEADNECQVPAGAEIGSFEQLNPMLSSSTVPIQPRSQRSIFLQRLVTLFAGRRRCLAITERIPSTQTPHEEQLEVPNKRQQRSLPASQCATVHSGGHSPPKSIFPKNLPLSPPILAPRRPYYPIYERPSACFIPPARIHKYTGYYHVTPDVYAPVEVQQGFPSAGPPKSPTPPMRRQNSDSEFLDRNETLWAKWYAKNPTAEHLPFAKANEARQRRDGRADEVTDQQLWDAHTARHAKFRKAPPPPVTDEDVSRQLDDVEHERAARLRNHAGQCFMALTGNVYPFNDGHII